MVIFRGFPLVVQLFIWYFGLPHIGIYFTPYLASVIGFSLCSGAYHSEYVRGAFLSIKRGQRLAAQAVGFAQLVLLEEPQAALYSWIHESGGEWRPRRSALPPLG